jgi:AraC family transcriptional regulator of adaptative response/methylated-DNA-[protein]-cysteine methyltransferase
MENSNSYYYKKVEEALLYLENNFTLQPNLEQIAQNVHTSPFHFQKIFTEWVGVSPKKYLQYLSVNHAKGLLKENTLSATAYELGLSSTGRLHDLFVNIEGMTPGEYKKGGKTLTINYIFADSYFGKILIASTDIGVCHIGFADDEILALADLKKRFPFAQINRQENANHQPVLSVFNADWNNLSTIKLHLKGTKFQLQVWNALLQIPKGRLASYGDIAEKIGNPKASRAVGTAIGNNPIAYLIPCHRVIQANGTFGNYHWGSVRKKAILGWEFATTDNLAPNEPDIL